MRIAVLASGSGTNLEAIIDAGLPVVVVVADRRCRALDVAAAHRLPGVLVERCDFGAGFDRVRYTEAVVDVLRQHDVELVVMAGWGTILEKPIFDAFEGRVLNTHPALLPAFPGWHAVADALAEGAEVTGVTVHVAISEVDAGPILAQQAVAVLPGDTEETLHQRIKEVERRLYPATIAGVIARGRVLD